MTRVIYRFISSSSSGSQPGQILLFRGLLRCFGLLKFLAEVRVPRHHASRGISDPFTVVGRGLRLCSRPCRSPDRDLGFLQRIDVAFDACHVVVGHVASLPEWLTVDVEIVALLDARENFAHKDSFYDNTTV